MTPTFISHCETVYRALEERSTVKQMSGTSPPVEELVFTGKVAEVYKSLSISQSYYGPVFRALEDVGAILKLQRGGKGVDTVFVLKGLPEVWPEGLGWKGKNTQPLTDDSRYGTILLEVQEIGSGIIGGINVVLALAELESRIEALEKQERHNGKTSRSKTKTATPTTGEE